MDGPPTSLIPPCLAGGCGKHESYVKEERIGALRRHLVRTLLPVYQCSQPQMLDLTPAGLALLQPPCITLNRWSRTAIGSYRPADRRRRIRNKNARRVRALMFGLLGVLKGMRSRCTSL